MLTFSVLKVESCLSKESEVKIDIKLQFVGREGDDLDDLGSWEFSGIIKGGREERLNWLDAFESLSENSIFKSEISFLKSRESSLSTDKGFSQLVLIPTLLTFAS